MPDRSMRPGTEFTCESCGITVCTIAGMVPVDSLCFECRVIAHAHPDDRAALARIFHKEIKQGREIKTT